MTVPFNQPFTVGPEVEQIKDAIARNKICGDGFYTHKCHDFLERKLGVEKALLTHSGTAALEMAALLLDIRPGDEIIMPSFTFVSTANAFVLRGGVPIFIDIRPDTLNIDETLIEQAITPKTKAICVVHYAGVACEMDTILEIAHRHGLSVVEDAAQAVGSFYKGKPLGTFGSLGCFSFHETKNIICGEGGALIINDVDHVARAEVIREKGTNRSQFFRGEVDKYTWVDIGSSYLPSDILAAFLYAQLGQMDAINANRMETWNFYNTLFREWDGVIRRPIIPETCHHNAHMYYVLFNALQDRSRFIDFMKSKDIYTVFHYIPLHSSPAGRTYGRVSGTMAVTDEVSDRLVRLPLYYNMGSDERDKIAHAVREFMHSL